MNFPTEILLNIFVFIPNDTFNISRVCKLFRKIIDNRCVNDLYYSGNSTYPIELVIINDSYLLPKCFLPGDNYEPAIVYEDSFYWIHTKYLSSSNCLNFIANYYRKLFVKKSIKLDSDLHKNKIRHVIKNICFTNNISGVKYLKTLLEYDEKYCLMERNFALYLIYKCFYKKLFVMAEHLFTISEQMYPENNVCFYFRNEIIDCVILSYLTNKTIVLLIEEHLADTKKDKIYYEFSLDTTLSIFDYLLKSKRISALELSDRIKKKYQNRKNVQNSSDSILNYVANYGNDNISYIHNKMENDNKYEKNCELFKQLITKSFPNLKYNILYNDETLLNEIYLPQYNANISILKTNNWVDIKRHINTKINELWKINDCTLCFQKIDKNVTCSKCSNNWCGKCYIELFRVGKGIMKCPHCRFTWGVKTPDSMMEICIKEIEYKLGY